MKLTQTYLADFVSLIFPELCQACGESLVSGEKLICTGCLFELPYTDFHQQADNAVARQFWGKLPLKAAYALCYFTKGGKMQHLMHQFKYNGVKDIGTMLGKLAGDRLLKNEVYSNVDTIIPVPLHKSRLRKRGYNQSKYFADGLAAKLDVPVLENLVRTKATSTQTKRSRFSRFQNMQQVFGVVNADELKDKHILLVDDIITTGSTLEACCIELMKIEGVRISVAAMAYAEG